MLWIKILFLTKFCKPPSKKNYEESLKNKTNQSFLCIQQNCLFFCCSFFNLLIYVDLHIVHQYITGRCLVKAWMITES